MKAISSYISRIGYRITDLVGLGSSFQGVAIFRRRAITIILSFFIVLITMTQLSLKLVEPHIGIHDIKSAGVICMLIVMIIAVQRLSRFFWVWLILTTSFFINLVFLGVNQGTGIQTGAVMLAVFMPIMGTYFIGRPGAVGGWILGIPTVSFLYYFSVTHAPDAPVPAAAIQIFDLYLMSMGGLTLSLFMALTLHQALVQSLNEAEKNLSRARASEMERTRFFGTVSHEVRNSLNGIFGITTSLLRDDLPDHIRKQVELVQSSGDSLVRVLNDMLELTRLESNGIEISLKSTELSAVPLRAASRWQLGVADKGLEIRIENAPDMPEWGMIDYGRLTQIMDNLISNAIRFTNSGHITLGLSSKPLDDGHITMEIRVSDTGVGIHGGQVDRIFEPYRQESSSTFAKHGGTGLGLYICRLLLSQMNGTIEVESTSSQGTTFLVSLPVELSEPPEDDALMQKSAASIKAATRVLAVDDRLPNRVYLETLFKSWNMDITTADSGQDCLKKAKEDAYDLLLLDLNMPEMNGTELLSRLRNSSSPNKDIQTIVVSADIPDETLIRLKRLGVELYLKKPITPKMLWEMINKACASKAEEKDNSTSSKPLDYQI